MHTSASLQSFGPYWSLLIQEKNPKYKVDIRISIAQREK